jgi:signal transduction histidine kinase
MLSPTSLNIEVEDHGIGIPQDKISSLFKEFSKVKNDENLNPSGIGLGLYICKKVVEGCGGNIKVARSVQKSLCKQDHGTTFEFSMPILEEINTRQISSEDEEN